MPGASLVSVSADAQATFAATLVDEWVRCGVAHAVACPGSRSTPLALALADADRRGSLALHVRLDERSAGFFALGIGLATGRPAVVLTTSGTAAVELHPAVVEAHQARVPLLVCTADRPVELHQVGAPQTVEQEGLYGRAVRWAISPGVAEGATSGQWRSMAARLVAEATRAAPGPGPVHANLAFRDPLVGSYGPLPPGRRGGRPWHRVLEAEDLGVDAEAVRLLAGWKGRRGIVVAGSGSGLWSDRGPWSAPVASAAPVAEYPHPAYVLAEALGWPLLADPRSGARLAGRCTVASADALLRDPSFAVAHRPEVVLRLGAPWASSIVGRWLGALGEGVEQVLVDRWGTWADPERTAATVVRADPGALCRAVVSELTPHSAQCAAHRLVPGTAPGDGAWLESWAGAEAAAQRAIDAVLAQHREPTEPGVARSLLASLPPQATLVVGSSMPVRDLECYGGSRAAPPRVLSNRGANGIDGTVSTTLGVAAAGTGPTVGLMGDLAFLYDASALLGATDQRSAAVLVVVDNSGGGIFSFLPQARAVEPERFELLWGTPPAADLSEVAAAYRVGVTEVGAAAEVAQAVAEAIDSGACAVVRVRTDRRANVAVHEEIHAAVALALRP